jgi:menaquinol-cytochrome c reductase cytochrome b/c subunit
VQIPEHLLQRSAEARAAAMGVSVAEAMAQMTGEAPPTPVAEVAPVPAEQALVEQAPVVAAQVAAEPATVEHSPAASAPGQATLVRPTQPAQTGPEGVRTQRLLTVVRAKAIQGAKSTPTDKVNTWPHLVVVELGALLAVLALLVILSTILQAPLLEAANFNATPNPSKAPWYFLGLQELLSYFDPQIAGVSVPTITGMIGFMAIPYVDKNPSNKPSDRKFAIFMYTIFMMGSATLTIIGVLFRGPGFNFTYPWNDGIFFDDLKDWIFFPELHHG